MAIPLRLLIIEDNPSDAELAIHALRRAGYEPISDRVETEVEYRARLAEPPEVILADFNMPEFDPLLALEIVQEQHLDVPFIVVSGSIGEEIAVDVMRRGAADYIMKDRLGRLGQAVAHALEKKHLRNEMRRAERCLDAQHAATKAIADSPDLEVAVPRVFEAICVSMGWVWAGFWVVDKHIDALQLTQSWQPPAASLDDFQASCRGKVFQYGEGLPGRVWATGEPEWVPDVMRDDHLLLKPAANRSGLHCAVAFPITCGREVLGVMEFFSKRVEAPRGEVFVLMAAIGSQVGQFIERKRSEKVLRLSEERLRTLLAATSAIVWDSPPSGQFDSEQPGWTAYTGQTIEQHRGWGWLNAIHPDDREKSVRAWVTAQKDRVEYHVEHRLLRADGHYRQMSVRAVPILEPGGEIREWVGVHTEVHELRKAQIDRNAVLTRLELHIQRMPLAYILFDADFRISDWNPAAERIFGYSKAEAIGTGVLELVPESFRQGAQEILRRIRGGDMSVSSINENLTRDGRTIVCEWYNTPLIEEDGRFTGYIALGQDVTQQQQLETQFRQAQKRLQHVVASSPAVLFTLAIADGEMRGIGWISDNLREVFGHSPEDALGPDWWPATVHPEDRDRIIAHAQKALFKHGRTNHEYRFRHGDGTFRWTSGELRLIRDASGNAVEVVGALSDISERTKLEEQFRQSQKMDAFGQLAGGVAHDFNNLLTIISGYSEIVLDALPSGDPNREMVQEVYKAGERAALLTRQLLAFSRKQVVQTCEITLNAIVADTQRMLERLIGEDVKLTTSLAPDLDRVNADMGQIEQVIVNLVVNARDAMPQGGRITMETANVDLDETYGFSHTEVIPGRYVLLAVSDNGCGMTEEIQRKIFEPFFTTKEVGKGTGLGLATVFGIVKHGGGHIRVYSEIGHGTTFKIYLPSVEEVAPVSPMGVAPAASAKANTETILIVEDEAAVRMLTRMALEKHGYTVLEACDGQEAIRICEQHSGLIHILITDVVMPQMGGRELAEKLTVQYPKLRLLFVSGYTDDAVVRHGVLEAEVAFLQKPFTVAALTRKVRSVLETSY